MTNKCDVLSTVLLVAATVACGGKERTPTTTGIVLRDGGQPTADAGHDRDAGTALDGGGVLIGPCPAGMVTGGLPYEVHSDSTGASSEFEPTCGGTAGPDVAFVWTPAVSGTVRISTHGSSYDSVLSVLDGACTGAELVCNDDVSPGDLTSELDVAVTAGRTVTIVVDALDPNEVGEFSLRIWQP